MRILGLTGSIGMGKSTALAFLQAQGWPGYSADQAVHELYDSPFTERIETLFPGVVRRAADGRRQLDRQALAARLAAAEQQPGAPGLRELEALVHPAVFRKQREFVLAQAAAGHELAVLEIPLLFETGSEHLADRILVVSAPADLQRARLMDRPGMSAEKLDHLLQRQMPDEEKRRRADFVVATDAGIEAMNAQLAAIITGWPNWPDRALDEWRQLYGSGDPDD